MKGVLVKKKDLESMTVAQLKAMARKLSVKVLSAMRKDEIVDTLLPVLRKQAKTNTRRKKVLSSKLSTIRKKISGYPALLPRSLLKVGWNRPSPPRRNPMDPGSPVVGLANFKTGLSRKTMRGTMSD